jgi:prepilin-type N-terminal cleavage/methylation domain-containing protein
MKIKSNNQGFTLIELLVVIAITAVLFAAAFTAQSRILIDTYLDTKTEEIVQTLRLAQMRSITRFQNSQWGVHFDEIGSDDQFILFIGNTYPPADISWNIQTDMPDSLYFSDISFNGGGGDIVFEKLTGQTSDYGSVQINHGLGVTKTIIINAMGQIEVN